MILLLFPAGNREFWAKLWQEARENSPVTRRRCRSEEEMVDNWNRRARWFARRTGNEQGRKRQKAVLDMLKRKGALGPGMKVLDIGAGPGNYAIPMARMCGQVTALEPAAEMVKILEDRARAEQVDNITVMQRTWQEVRVEEDGLAGQFDLVFASMTPGVQDPETLQKMIAASKKFCYLSSFSGRRWGKPYRDLWQRFFNEDMGDSPGDIIYPFGFLYAMGYRPDLSFFTVHRVNEEPVEEAVENLSRFFWSYMDITPEVKQVIEQYVAERAQNGIFYTETNFCHGMMLWRVDEVFA